MKLFRRIIAAMFKPRAPVVMVNKPNVVRVKVVKKRMFDPIGP